MTVEQSRAPTPSKTTVLTGWIFAGIFSIHSILGVILPRLEKESAIRELGRGWHYLLGFAIAILAIWLIRRWYRDGFIIAPGSLQPALRYWHGMIAVLLVMAPLLAVPLGLLNAWGEGRTVHLAGMVNLPTLMGEERAIWQFAGYFHSALGLTLTMASFIGLISAGCCYLLYRKGLLAVFPAGLGIIMLVKVTVFIYAINSFKEREPGYIAAAVTLAIAGTVWLIGSRWNRSARSEFVVARPTKWPLYTGATVIAAAVTFAMFVPYILFRVTPFPTGIKVATDPGITWHRERLSDVEISAPTQFEQTVAMETYKWCEFCHTVDPGAKPLVGPNLHNIFGQKAGTVPNFYYSQAMAKAGQNGLVWDEETLDAFLADPENFIPGTAMRISSGPVDDPEVRKAVINILKRRTMADAEE